MINVIKKGDGTLSDEVFEQILEYEIETSYQEHRRDSSFFCREIVEINEKNAQGRDDLFGLWETNQYVWSEEDSCYIDDVKVLTRVVKREVLIPTIIWDPVGEPIVNDLKREDILKMIEKIDQEKKRLLDEIKAIKEGERP